MDPFPVRFGVVHVQLVLRSSRIEGAEFEQDFDRSLVFGGGDPSGALPFKLYRLFCVFYCKGF